MRKLLAVFACMATCIVLGFGAAGCTKKDKQERSAGAASTANPAKAAAKPSALQSTAAPATTSAAPTTAVAPSTAVAPTTTVPPTTKTPDPAKAEPKKDIPLETPKIEPAPAPKAAPKVEVPPPPPVKGVLLNPNLSRPEFVPALTLRNSLVG